MDVKTIGLLGILGLLAAAGGVAAQQAPSGQNDRVRAPSGLNGSSLASDLMGSRVESPRGQQIGMIRNLVVQGSGRVSHAIVSTGDPVAVGGAKSYLVPFERFDPNPESDIVVLKGVEGTLSSEFVRFEEVDEEIIDQIDRFREPTGEIIPDTLGDP